MATMPPQAPNSGSPRNIWLEMFGWRTLFRWDVLSTIVPGVFLAVGLALMGLMGIDWFPHHLLVAQVCVGVASVLCITKFVGQALQHPGDLWVRTVFAAVMCLAVLLLAIPFEVVLQTHKHPKRADSGEEGITRTPDIQRPQTEGPPNTPGGFNQELPRSRPATKTPYPAQPPPLSASVKFLGMSVVPGVPAYGPGSFRPTLNYVVTDGTVYHLRILSVGFAVTEDINFPGMVSKLYRVFDKMAASPNVKEVPEMAANQPLSSTPQITSAFGGGVSDIFAILYTHLTWIDKSGTRGELTNCYTTRLANNPIDATTPWSLCEVEAPSPLTLKYERMKPTELLDTLGSMEKRLQSEASAGSNDAMNETSQQVLEEVRQGEKHYNKDICSSVEPLIEEVMFRFSYVPQWELSDRAIEMIPAPDRLMSDSSTIRLQERRLVRDTEDACNAEGYYPPSEDVARALELLSIGLTVGIENGGEAIRGPFNVRPQ